MRRCARCRVGVMVTNNSLFNLIRNVYQLQHR